MASKVKVVFFLLFFQLLETKAQTSSQTDPDVGRNLAQVIEAREFESEKYSIITKDGYELTIYRIVNPEVEESYRPKMKPVLLAHGLELDGSGWVINSPQVRPRFCSGSNNITGNGTITADGENLDHPNALGYYLSNECYDVFIANFRGTVESRGHVSKPPPNPLYWNFSYDEISAYDLPAILSEIQNITGKEKIGYVGHSQGTLIMFALMSDHPEYADIVEPFVALAPVAYGEFVTFPLRPLFELAAPFGTTIYSGILTTPFNKIAPGFCDSPLNKAFCDAIYYFLFNYDGTNFDDNRWSAYLSFIPSGTSLKNIAHYGQAYINGRFAKYDYGLDNFRRYGQIAPPSYPLAKIRSNSIVLIKSDNDVFVQQGDFDHLVNSLTVKPKIIDVSLVNPLWNHIDFVYSRYAGEVVNTHVVDAMRQYRES